MERHDSSCSAGKQEGTVHFAASQLSRFIGSAADSEEEEVEGQSGAGMSGHEEDRPQARPKSARPVVMRLWLDAAMVLRQLAHALFV
eukprot:COSAG01_NODE_2006_length_8667_cov_36.171569_10_plen_87_part_00